MARKKAEVSKRQYSSKAKGSNVHYFAAVIWCCKFIFLTWCCKWAQMVRLVKSYK
jgi:hypothetical protein